ncbi:MAG: hypothetical protein ABI566_00530 [Pseudolysinimonas sp.]
MTGRHAAATDIDDEAVADREPQRPPAHRAESDGGAAPVTKKPAARRRTATQKESS